LSFEFEVGSNEGIMTLDAVDTKLLNLVQNKFPVVPEPYRELGDVLGVSEEEVIERLRNLTESGIIRRLGGVFDSRGLGYTGTLVGMKVPAERVDEVAAVINAYPGITHNYLREHEYNMWFTILADSPERVEKILREVVEKTGNQDILNLPVEQYFKIMVNFELNEV
jgi:DNA-binding Lrp family transcriptional regulator